MNINQIQHGYQPIASILDSKATGYGEAGVRQNANVHSSPIQASPAIGGTSLEHGEIPNNTSARWELVVVDGNTDD